MYKFFLKHCTLTNKKCSKPAENHQTLITNCLQETLTLAQYTENDENIQIFKKTSRLTLTNEFLFFNILSVFLASSFIFVQRRKYLQ